MREEFEKESYEKDKPRFLLSAAVGAAKQRIEAGYEIEEICKYFITPYHFYRHTNKLFLCLKRDFDFINVMSYDYHGAWDGVTGHNSPLYGRKDEIDKEKEWNINSSMHIWIGLDIDIYFSFKQNE